MKCYFDSHNAQAQCSNCGRFVCRGHAVVNPDHSGNKPGESPGKIRCFPCKYAYGEDDMTKAIELRLNQEPTESCLACGTKALTQSIADIVGKVVWNSLAREEKEQMKKGRPWRHSGIGFTACTRCKPIEKSPTVGILA